ncbi:hypothetical protein OQA88_3470 [Cercophora sp. LCS_1]
MSSDKDIAFYDEDQGQFGLLDQRPPIRTPSDHIIKDDNGNYITYFFGLERKDPELGMTVHGWPCLRCVINIYLDPCDFICQVADVPRRNMCTSCLLDDEYCDEIKEYLFQPARYIWNSACQLIPVLRPRHRRGGEPLDVLSYLQKLVAYRALERACLELEWCHHSPDYDVHVAKLVQRMEDLRKVKKVVLKGNSDNNQADALALTEFLMQWHELPNLEEFDSRRPDHIQAADDGRMATGMEHPPFLEWSMPTDDGQPHPEYEGGSGYL